MTSHSKSQDAGLTGALSGAGRGLSARGLSARGFFVRAFFVRAFFVRTGAALDGWVATAFYWRSVSRTIHRLSSLSDAELKRLGLERSEIVARVYEEARAGQDRRR
jgi:uncharacterized protein YjiS (DUF1127 family)